MTKTTPGNLSWSLLPCATIAIGSHMKARAASNANLYHVKQLLGHKSFETLNHYAKLDITDLRKTHERFHPREKDEF